MGSISNLALARSCVYLVQWDPSGRRGLKSGEEFGGGLNRRASGCEAPAVVLLAAATSLETGACACTCGRRSGLAY